MQKSSQQNLHLRSFFKKRFHSENLKTRGQTIYVATNEAAHNDPSHLDLHCMQIQLHIFSFLLLLVLTLKGPSKVAADDSYFFYFLFFKENKA